MAEDQPKTVPINRDRHYLHPERAGQFTWDFAGLLLISLFVGYMLVEGMFHFMHWWCDYNVYTGVLTELIVGSVMAALMLVIQFTAPERAKDGTPANTRFSFRYYRSLNLATHTLLTFVAVSCISMPWIYLTDFDVPTSGYKFCVNTQPAPAKQPRETMWDNVMLTRMIVGFLTLYALVDALVYTWRADVVRGSTAREAMQ